MVRKACAVTPYISSIGWPSWTSFVSGDGAAARRSTIAPPPHSHPASSQDRPQFHPCEALVEPRIRPQAVPLRRNSEMDQPRIAYVEGAWENTESLVEVSHFSGTRQRPNHGIAAL